MIHIPERFRGKYKLFLVILVAHGLFFTIKLSLGNFFFIEDSFEYYRLAENIKHGVGFYSGDIHANIQFEDYTKRPPLYSIFILVFSFLLHSKIAVLFMQNVLSIASIFMCLRLFEAYHKPISQKILLAFLLTSLSQFVYSNYLMSEILLQFLIVLLCYLFHAIVTEKKWQYLVCFQAVIILLFLTKPVFYLFVVPNLVLSVWFTKHIKNAYLYAFLPIIACVLYMNWNYQRTGSFEFSSIQNINLKNYNLYYFNVNKYGEAYAQEVNSKISAIANAKNTYAEQQKAIKEQSISYLKKDGLEYAFMHLKGSLRIFFDPGRFDIHNFFELKNTGEMGFLNQLNKNGIGGALNYFKNQPLLVIVLIPILLLFNVFKLIGFVLFWVRHYKTAPALYWFMLLIILYIVGLTGPIGAARFLVPILPMYLLFATSGLSKSYR
ncbi:MAG: glycosyltransferase family 39 protein [Confluentibacter sp.]|nr:glycosyltransferase family 39 protein [Confluentibacter sp.]